MNRALPHTKHAPYTSDHFHTGMALPLSRGLWDLSAVYGLHSLLMLYPDEDALAFYILMDTRLELCMPVNLDTDSS